MTNDALRRGWTRAGTRRARPGDTEAIGRLAKQEAELQERLGGYELDPEFDWPAWAAARLRGSGYRFFVAEHEGDIVGYTYGRLRAPPRKQTGATRGGFRALAKRAAGPLLRRFRPRSGSPARFDGWGIIESLYVVESARRQGIARALVTRLRDELGALGATSIEISVMACNQAALAFWSGLGYRQFRVHLRIGPGLDKREDPVS